MSSICSCDSKSTYTNSHKSQKKIKLIIIIITVVALFFIMPALSVIDLMKQTNTRVNSLVECKCNMLNSVSLRNVSITTITTINCNNTLRIIYLTNQTTNTQICWSDDKLILLSKNIKWKDLENSNAKTAYIISCFLWLIPVIIPGIILLINFYS